MKRCFKCKGSFPATNAFFHNNKSKKDGLSSFCKSCASKRRKEYYRTRDDLERAAVMQNKKKRRDSVQEKFLAFLKIHPCVDCGEDDCVILDCDHVRGPKVGNVSDLVRDARSWEIIEAELAKCVVRCAGCHRRKTAKDQNTFRHKSASIV